jgi:hypothetical protein
MNNEIPAALEEIAARQTETLEALQSLKRSEINLKYLEEIEEREREILSEIESLIENKR